MTENKFKPSSKVVFHPLLKRSIPDQKGLFVIVRSDTDNTLKIENDAFQAVKLIEKGVIVSEVSRKIGRTRAEVIGLLEALGESGFIKSVDGVEISDDFPKIKPNKFFLTEKQLQFMTSKYLWIPTIILIIVGFFLSLTHPELAPSFRQFFWTGNLWMVYFSLFLLETLFIVLHELVHFLVTLAVGGQAKVRLSNRFLNIVAETESYRLSLVDKPKRYLVYLSAMAFNLSIVSMVYILLTQTAFLIHSTTRALLLATVLLNIQCIIWQFNLFLRTDIYNFLSDYLGNDNLHNNSMLYVVQKIRVSKHMALISRVLNLGRLESKLATEADDLQDLDNSERRHLPIYSILFIIGIVFVSLQYLVFIIPRDLYFISTSINDIAVSALGKNIIAVLASISLILLVSWKYIALGFIYFKKLNNHGTTH